VQDGSDGEIMVDGVTVATTENRLAQVVPGLVLTARAAGRGPQTIEVAPDQESVTARIQALIDEYNGALNEVRTDTQPADTDGNNRGTLANDPMVSRLRTALRDAVTRPVSAAGEGIENLAQIGITTTRDGALQISDSAALQAAIKGHPSAVEALFNGSDGVAQRLTTLLDTYSRAGGVLSRMQNSVQSRIKTMDTRISRANQALTRRQELLTKQIAALQASVSALSSQSDYISSLMDVTAQILG
jgi:flagellar hook-associated protein 2